jgi:hypothetical protein
VDLDLERFKPNLGDMTRITVLGCRMRKASSGLVVLVCGVSSRKDRRVCSAVLDLRLRQSVGIPVKANIDSGGKANGIPE